MKEIPSAVRSFGTIALLALSACGTGSQEVKATGLLPEVSGVGFPLVLTFADGDRFEIERPPQRILPANAGCVDFLTLLVVPERVAALPVASDGYSRLSAATDEAASWNDLPRFSIYAAEAVLAMEPDLVLTHTWQTPETSALLRRTGLGVLSLPTPRSWSDILDTLRLYGRVLGAEERAEQVATQLSLRVEALALRAVANSPLRVMSYANFGAGGSTAGGETTLDVVFELAGLTNAAADAGIEGYVTLDHERLLTIDPDIIVVDAAGDAEEHDETSPQGESYLRSQPELATLRALSDGRIIALPPMLFTSVSTELVRAAEELQRALGWL